MRALWPLREVCYKPALHWLYGRFGVANPSAGLLVICILGSLGWRIHRLMLPRRRLPAREFY